MIKHVFFDMDGTLTPSRQQISRGMNLLLKDLGRRRDIVIVSGARYEQIEAQMGQLHPYVVLSQNGNYVVEGEYELWSHELNWMQKLEVFLWIAGKRPSSLEVESIEDLVEDRGCQISYSMIGHNAPIDRKRSFDPSCKIRKGLIEQFPFESKTVKHAIGGTTCIDFYLHTKGENIAQLVKEKGWKKEECLYVGDQLFRGGNDFTVVGVVPTMQVASPEETEDAIRTMLLS